MLKARGALAKRGDSGPPPRAHATAWEPSLTATHLLGRGGTRTHSNSAAACMGGRAIIVTQGSRPSLRCSCDMHAYSYTPPQGMAKTAPRDNGTGFVGYGSRRRQCASLAPNASNGQATHPSRHQGKPKHALTIPPGPAPPGPLAGPVWPSIHGLHSRLSKLAYSAL